MEGARGSGVLVTDLCDRLLIDDGAGGTVRFGAGMDGCWEGAGDGDGRMVFCLRALVGGRIGVEDFLEDGGRIGAVVLALVELA